MKLKKILKQAVDQTLHFLLGFLVVVPLLLWPDWVGGMVTALMVAAIREWEQRPVERVGDFFLDVFFVVAGGVVCSLLLGQSSI